MAEFLDGNLLSSPEIFERSLAPTYEIVDKQPRDQMCSEFFLMLFVCKYDLEL